MKTLLLSVVLVFFGACHATISSPEQPPLDQGPITVAVAPSYDPSGISPLTVFFDATGTRSATSGMVPVSYDASPSDATFTGYVDDGLGGGSYDGVAGKCLTYTSGHPALGGGIVGSGIADNTVVTGGGNGANGCQPGQLILSATPTPAVPPQTMTVITPGCAPCDTEPAFHNLQYTWNFDDNPAVASIDSITCSGCGSPNALTAVGTLAPYNVAETWQGSGTPSDHAAAFISTTYSRAKCGQRVGSRSLM